MSISSLNTTTNAPPLAAKASSPSQAAAISTTTALTTSLGSTLTSNETPNNVTTITTTQLVKGKELISNKANADLIKIKVANVERPVKTIVNETKSLVISNINTEAKTENANNNQEEVAATPLSQVTTVPKLNAPGLMKSKIMTSTGGSIQICLAQPTTINSNTNNNTTANNQAITPTMQTTTLTLSAPKSLIISSAPNVSNTNASNFSIAQTIKFANNNSTSSPNVQSGHTATILNVLNDSQVNNNNNTAPPVIKAISLNAQNFIPIQTSSTPATTPTEGASSTQNLPTLLNFPTSNNNRKINSTIKTSNNNANTLSLKQATTLISGNNTSTINNIVKNLLSNSSNAQTTANAVAAVTEAHKLYNQMNSLNNENNNSNPTTTTITLSNNMNSITSNGSKILSTNIHNHNPITIVANELNEINGNMNHTSTRTNQINVPSISSASKIVLTNNNSQKVTTPSILSLTNESTSSKSSLPINLKTTSSNQSIPSNGAISSINLKPLSPVPFLIDNVNNNPTLTLNSCKLNPSRTIITSSSTTPPPSNTTTVQQQLPNSLITLNNSPLNINQTNISNYIKNSNSNNNNSIISINSASFNNLNSSIYKTISTSSNSSTQHQQFLSNIVNLTNSNQAITSSSASSSSSQTIAQLCSSLNNHHVNTSQPSIISSIIQPIRFIANQNNSNYHPHRNHSHHVNNTNQHQNLTIQNQYLNQIQLNPISNSNLTMNLTQSTSTISGQNAVNALNANLTPNSGNASSPSSSPLKPNIIRKHNRRDSPSSSNTNSNNEQILNMQMNHSLHGSNASSFKDIKHPIFDLSSQEPAGSKIISISSLSIPSFISSNSQSANQINTVSLTNSDVQAQVLPFASTSSSAAPSSSSSSSCSSSTSKPVITLNSDSTTELSKNVRKFTVNTQQHIPQSSSPAANSLATSSSSASSSAPTSLQSSSNSSILPSYSSSGGESLQFDKEKLESQVKDEVNQTNTARKRRKQEFRKAINEEPVLINYSNNPFCPNRYLNENTNISNNNSNTNLKNNKNRILNKIYRNDLPIRHGEYFDDNEADLRDDVTVSSIDDDEHHPPSSKQIRLNDINTKSKQIVRKKINQNDFLENDIKKEEKIICNDENLTDGSSQINEEDTLCLDDETVQRLSKEFSYITSDGVKWVTKRRSNIATSKTYKPEWNPRKHHYVHYSDIKLDNENLDQIYSKSAANTITHKELIENLNEWKFHFVISQVKNLMNYENESLDVINEMENLMQNSNFIEYSDVCIKINESIKANSQRHKFVNEQLDEAQILIHKLFDHKDKFKNLVLLSQSTSTKATSSASLRSNENMLAASIKNQSSSNSKNNKNLNSPHGLKKNFKKNISTRSGNLKGSTIATSSTNHVKTNSFKQSKNN